MKLFHTLAIVAVSASLGACIIAPPRPPFVQITNPVASAYVEVAPVVQVAPYISVGWWDSRYWGGGNHHRHNH